MNFKRIFYYYWQAIKQNKIAFFSAPIFYTIRFLLSSTLIAFLYKNIIDELSNNNLDSAINYLLPFALALIIAPIANRYGDYIYFRFFKEAIKYNYLFAYKRIQLHSYTFFTNNFTGSLVSKIRKYNKAFEKTIDILFHDFLPIIVMIIASVSVLFYQSKKLAIYFLIWSLIYSFFVLFFVKKKITIDMERSLADSKITGVLSDSLTNIFNIKIFSAFKKEMQLWDFTVTDFTLKAYRTWIFSLVRNLFQGLFMVGFHIFILYTMLHLWKDGEITIGVFVLAYSYLTGLFERVWNLSSSVTHFMEFTTDAREMVDIFDKSIDILDPANPEPLRIKDGEIKFENVSFEYVGDAEVFNDFNLHIKKGERIGLVGHSGSGKSTITKMLLRFVDLKDGSITIDGQNIKNITQDDLRSKISYVPQDTILFHRSIFENIAYSKEGASMEEVIEAARKAHAHEFISNFKDGYDTLVGERGVKLSGGERQRIAIARAMLKDAPILILDEATSSLDSISESYIQEAFNELMKDKTTIVIAHRLSTIQKMDRILVLDKGVIIEEGTHDELRAKSGMYASLWDHQTGGFM